MKPLTLTMSIKDNWDLLLHNPSPYQIIDLMLLDNADLVDDFIWLTAAPYGWELEQRDGNFVLEISHRRDSDVNKAPLNLLDF